MSVLDDDEVSAEESTMEGVLMLEAGDLKGAKQPCALFGLFRVGVSMEESVALHGEENATFRFEPFMPCVCKQISLSLRLSGGI